MASAPVRSLEIFSAQRRVRHERAAMRLATGGAVAMDGGTELAVDREANRAAEAAAGEQPVSGTMFGECHGQAFTNAIIASG